MSSDSIFLNDSSFNRNLTTKILSIDDLRIYLRFRFGDYQQAAIRAQISKNRLIQILMPYNLPKTRKLVKRLADAWDIDPIILTQLFERSRREDDD